MSELPESLNPEILPTRPKLWRWVLGTFIILISWLVIGAIFTAIVAEQFGLDLQVLAGTDKESLATIRS
ncbi:MAG: hypothetical protein EB045_05885, partial [Actinobacteria bacterium]|nr:hypothetical protein [Actinomycetota bacterium]